MIGLGRLPKVESASSLLLFNSNVDVYNNYKVENTKTEIHNEVIRTVEKKIHL